MDRLIKSSVDTNISGTHETDELWDKVFYINRNTVDIDYDGILNKVLQYVNMDEIMHSIKKGAEYVVQVPNELLSGLESGEFTIMENSKTKKMWPYLMRIAENGKNEIVSPLPIKKQEFIQGNPLQEICTGYHNLYMQKQLNHLTELTEKALSTVKSIEHGQLDDRIGLLNSGKQQILLALSQKDEEGRRGALQLGIRDICTAQNQIAKTFERRVTEFEPISKYAIIRFIKSSKSGYLDGKDDEYQEIQEYFNLYLNATKYLATCYAIFGDIANAKKVFEMSNDFIKQVDFSRLKTIAYAHKGSNFEGIYDFATEFIDTEKVTCLEEAKRYDCLSIEVSGEHLLEVILNERQEDIPKSKIE